MKRKKKIKRGRGKKNHYFTEEHEKHIIQFNLSTCPHEREKLYKESIMPVFDVLIDKLIKTFKFFQLDNLEYLKDDCRSHLLTVIDKFNPDKGSAAFTYFTVIIRNWFFKKMKDQDKEMKTNIQLDYIPVDVLEEKANMITYNNFLEMKESNQFWNFFHEEMEFWESEELKQNEKIVLNAIQEIFDKKEELEILNKKAIYMYLRELTGMNTKQVVSVLNKFRKKYKHFKREWDNGEV